MYINRELREGLRLTVVVRHHTEDRLKKTCFRGYHNRLAGNFKLWETAESLFRDPIVMEVLLEEVHELWQNRDFGSRSATVVHSHDVGWESTDLAEKFDLDELERFNPNRHSSALRVKQHLLTLKAPLAKLITLVFEFKDEDGNPTVIVHSIYPGTDIGELEGDVTEREDRVFFDWNHPGE